MCTGPCQARVSSSGLLTPYPLVTVTVRETAVPAEPTDTRGRACFSCYCALIERVCVHALSWLVGLCEKSVLWHTGLFESTSERFLVKSFFGLPWSLGFILCPFFLLRDVCLLIVTILPIVAFLFILFEQTSLLLLLVREQAPEHMYSNLAQNEFHYSQIVQFEYFSKIFDLIK